MKWGGGGDKVPPFPSGAFLPPIKTPVRNLDYGEDPTLPFENHVTSQID